MSITARTWFAIACDGCGTPFVVDDFEDPLPFRSVDDALATATACRWVVDPDGRLECEDCVDRRECLRRGHDWAAWVDQLALVGPPSRIRACRRCEALDQVETADLDTFPTSCGEDTCDD